ncbi:MAG: AI-2E family transporter [Candidatus Aquicultorales bacterium]
MHYEPYRALAFKVWAWVGICIIVVGAVWTLWQIQAVLPPFIYALLIVYLLRPLVNGLEDRKVPRVLAIVISYLLVVAAIALLLLIIIPIFVGEVKAFLGALPKQVESIKATVIDLTQRIRLMNSAPLNDALDSVSKSLSTAAMGFAKRIPETLVGIFGSTLNLVLAPLIAFYVLKDLRGIKSNIEKAIPARYREEGMDILKKIDAILGGFLKGQLLVAASVGVLVGISMAVLGIKYALLIGIISAIFNIIPYLGPIASGIPAVLIALETSPTLALIVVVVLLVVNQLDGLFISPNIMSQQVDLHPAVVIFALLTGGTLFNIMGMLLAIPVAAVGKAIYLHFREKAEAADMLETAGGGDLGEVIASSEVLQ